MHTPRTKKTVTVPLNRSEGDLEIHVQIEEGTIADAWSSGTMFRGFESMMTGRGALDGLVLTPRICGICSLTHLTAAAEALDGITGIRPPDNALRLRNLALMAETVQSDIRQSVLMFMADFANQEAYDEHPLGREAYARYAPLSGTSSMSAIRETKRLLEVVAIIGGQWPHTSFMVPGGVTRSLEVSEIFQCRMLIDNFRSWYEQTVLGCSIERWQAVTCATELAQWLEEAAEHRNGELGFFLRFARTAGLEHIGQGPNRYLSYGGLPMPRETGAPGTGDRLIASGVAEGTHVSPFDPDMIAEDVSHAWYQQERVSDHPRDGETSPYASGPQGGRYSWIKAPRYDGTVVETGPLAETVVGGDPLFQDVIREQGPNVLIRQLARLTRPARLLPAMSTWLQELQDNQSAPFYRQVEAVPDGHGAGLIQAARGALGHWVEVVDEKIRHYQIITPTTWNGSPRDTEGRPGAWEQALTGTALRDADNPVEAGHVVRSFDPCLVCAVHTVREGSETGKFSVGFRL